jgi:hypothetical protein
MFDQNSMKIENDGNFPTLKSLVAALDEADREYLRLDREGVYDDAAREPLNKREWALRSMVSATPARTLADLRLKAGVFQKEAERDKDFECDVDGSARDLARSLAADLLATETSEKGGEK